VTERQLVVDTLVVDTNVLVEERNLEKLKELKEHGYKVYIPMASLEELKKIKNGEYKKYWTVIVDNFIPISTVGTGIVKELKENLRRQGIEIKSSSGVKTDDVEAEIEEPDMNDLRILAAVVYLMRQEKNVRLLTHDRWLAQFAINQGAKVLGVYHWNGWVKKAKIPWKKLKKEVD
jgi:predicted ribonuclease YlaK